MNIELSDEEAVVLQNLLDVACRARGLEAAEACLVFCRKIVEARAVTAAIATASPAPTMESRA